MERRDLLKAFGAATALALLPHEALAAWSRVAGGLGPANGLSDAHLKLITSIADGIIPRTDTPSASDVRVPAFVDVIVTENYDDRERAAFLAGLDAIDAHVKSRGDLTATIDEIEAASERDAEPTRTYWRLKGLIVHGYFTSEPVMKDVLKTVVMPGRFDGAVPVPLKRATRAAAVERGATHDGGWGGGGHGHG